MAFEKVSKRDSYPGTGFHERVTEPFVTVNLKRGKLWLNRVICEIQSEKDYKFIRLLFDKETDTIGLDFSRHGNKSEYWVFNPKPNGYNISCLPFIRRFNIDRKVQDLGVRRFPAMVNHNLVTVQLVK